MSGIWGRGVAPRLWFTVCGRRRAFHTFRFHCEFHTLYVKTNPDSGFTVKSRTLCAECSVYVQALSDRRQRSRSSAKISKFKIYPEHTKQPRAAVCVNTLYLPLIDGDQARAPKYHHNRRSHLLPAASPCKYLLPVPPSKAVGGASGRRRSPPRRREAAPRACSA